MRRPYAIACRGRIDVQPDQLHATDCCLRAMEQAASDGASQEANGAGEHNEAPVWSTVKQVKTWNMAHHSFPRGANLITNVSIF